MAPMNLGPAAEMRRKLARTSGTMCNIVELRFARVADVFVANIDERFQGRPLAALIATRNGEA